MSDHGAGHDSDHGAGHEQGHEHALHELAAAYGVAVDYWDWQGRHVVVSTETLVAVLAALDVDASTAGAARAALTARADEAWRRMLPPVLVTRQGWRPTFEVHVPDGWSVDVWVELETGEHRGGVEQHDNWNPPREIDGELVGEATFAVPGDLPLGYHWVLAGSGDRWARMPLVVTPHRVGLPARLGDRPHWGLASQLYSARSAGSWGTGDLVRPRGPGRGSGRRPPRGLCAGQPAARRRAGRPDGALAVPPDLAALRQPAVHPPRADPRVRRPRRRPTGPGSTRSAVRPWPPTPSGWTVTAPGRPSARRSA